MMKQILSLFLVALCGVIPLVNAQLGALQNPGESPFLFHGVAVITHANYTTQWPGDNTIDGANFYCYVTDKGYVTFGWWLEPQPDTDYWHCRPDSRAYMWYEYADKMKGCDDKGCKAHVKNYRVSNNSKPDFETDYVFTTASLAEPEVGLLAISYFDEKKGASAVGTRHVLSSSASTAADCCKALTTLRNMVKKYSIKLPFELNDVCQKKKNPYSPWLHWGQQPLQTCEDLSSDELSETELR